MIGFARCHRLTDTTLNDENTAYFVGEPYLARRARHRSRGTAGGRSAARAEHRTRLTAPGTLRPQPSGTGDPGEPRQTTPTAIPRRSDLRVDRGGCQHGAAGRMDRYDRDRQCGAD